MKLLNEEEMKFCDNYINIIKQIVVTSSCSSIPPAYLEGLRNINKNYKYTSCVTCNSSIFLATNLLYKDWIYSKAEYDKIKLKNDGENESKGRNKGNKRNSQEKRKEGNDRKDQSIAGESN